MALTQDVHFLRPAWLLALPLLWGLSFWLARRRGRDGDWASFIDPDLLPALRLDGGGQPGRSPWPWLALAWTLAALALAGPSWQRAPSPAYRGNAAWVLVLDLSPSMSATDLPPNRVTRARYALDDLLNAARDARVGLVVFGDEPYTVTPLTDDVATVRALLPPLAPDILPTAGDNLAPALGQAGTLLEHGGGRSGQVVVLTDGFADPAAAFDAAGKLRARGVAVSVVGVGTPARGAANPQPLDVDRLRQLAASGGGRYVDLAGLPALIGDLQTQAGHAGMAKVKQDIRVAHWLDGGIWLLPFLLLLAAVLARRGWL
ncbi:MAG: VWA domain-containing protein [Hydrogenophilales bacterium]|nr:VWA domain-containing protein [Hydrogenophilales bacterium]